MYLVQVDDLYLAMRTFDDLMNDPRNHIRLKMEPGDMVTVKNMRVMHGRSELLGGISGRSLQVPPLLPFPPPPPPRLQCGYMDWDEIRSCMRVTRTRLADST